MFSYKTDIEQGQGFWQKLMEGWKNDFVVVLIFFGVGRDLFDGKNIECLRFLFIGLGRNETFQYLLILFSLHQFTFGRMKILISSFSTLDLLVSELAALSVLCAILIYFVAIPLNSPFSNLKSKLCQLFSVVDIFTLQMLTSLLNYFFQRQFNCVLVFAFRIIYAVGGDIMGVTN
eukprot:TRINITY_DN4548_c0_g1_i12.p3 TRINITY_DN4548_c0_g1~~TRINITY_DN4548_c0_g1_i12.p3  ORF type:complete len:175 (-),score=3.79 TRINITY_DN4548_c0_g1_i12:434-958(-)